MFDFTKDEYQYIIDKCMFNEELSAILELRIKGYSITQISLKLNISEATVKRRLTKIKKKIANIL